MNFDLEHFQEEIKQRKEFVDNCLIGCLLPRDSDPPLIHQAMHYAVFNGGKRLRPIMVLEGAKIAVGEAEQAIPAACALEMIHSYSLVHDDLPCMDDDDFRRGQPTCHRVFGEANAVLTGDGLLTAAFELLSRENGTSGIKPDIMLRVIAEIARAAGSRGMIGGQILDLEAEGKIIDYESLRKLHCLKTGQLFRAALRAGAIVGGIGEKGLLALSDYADNFGLAFQISDDILDVQGDAALTGKSMGSDARKEKNTYPSLLGLEKSRQLLEESIATCLHSLELFGPEAEFLRQLACYTLYRKS
ncbi:polyprenyl synthetase family protein [Syntrophomonas wolfei]|jgi:geranylgeranyl diphosphate synthase type II|uniref:Farnesyl diphosphate synthase n=1 Tax=Syntrophomonas wolfei TaxID=863 RepID=A0A354YSY6_9FIRM|nr:farnesyl diphosphate synthase [Syntrophomonas wolfei]HBK52435.1 geranyl transferase [Syntrophomonas wolfei]